MTVRTFLQYPFLFISLLCVPLTGIAAGLNDIEAIPHLDKTGQEAYRNFLASDRHRAFAIAPGGAWTWNGGGSSAESVAEDTLQTCEFDNGHRCILYALDNDIVFDSRVWAESWRPYLNQSEANLADTGLERGKRFYDLAFKNSSGKPMKLSNLQGKVVVLHFWGSWCPPCRREMPDMQELYQSLGKSADISMVLLQVREDFAASNKWARQQHLKLPLHDSGASKKTNGLLPLANGKSLHDRYIAEVFPTTYILDKHGIVLFSHTGPISHWSQYLPLLRDAAAHSGK